MSKRLLLSIATAVAAILIFISLYCKFKSTSSENKEDVAFRAYINACTSGIISSESTIRILLTNEMEAPIEIGKPIEKSVSGVDIKFAKIVDEFIAEHKDVLEQLAHK